MRLSYHVLQNGMRHGMTFGVVLLLVTLAIVSFLWRNWDTITLKMTVEGERRFKLIVGIILGLCGLGIIICCALGVYNYQT